MVAAEQHPDATNPGDTGGEAIPVPIPNTEVKLSSAEDTERAAFRENRSSPGFLRFRGSGRALVRRTESDRPGGTRADRPVSFSPMTVPLGASVEPAAPPESQADGPS